MHELKVLLSGSLQAELQTTFIGVPENLKIQPLLTVFKQGQTQTDIGQWTTVQIWAFLSVNKVANDKIIVSIISFDEFALIVNGLFMLQCFL